MAQDNHAGREENLAKIRELIKEIDFGMLTTVEEDGSLHSRPMSNNKEVEFDGDLWFFTYASSHKVQEVAGDQNVNVAFALPNKQIYISMTGTAQLVRDKEKIKQWWKPELKAWFPQGPDEPEIALLKVNVQSAEYWDGTSSKVAFAIQMVKSLATGKQPDLGEHAKVEL
ncbi:MAG: pyridoxamine 5'-phosphate oxidase family protein [Abitibacteriaceae bacterium]|nr:pyridoxamine 5'-phosphate oxidase family protein [Abditibacteriaceae bacterium]MBV9868201.1 pyridoxamine 5'-phosphate oxidase family protein [Abditibacteriaceae bacterium]